MIAPLNYCVLSSFLDSARVTSAASVPLISAGIRMSHRLILWRHIVPLWPGRVPSPGFDPIWPRDSIIAAKQPQYPHPQGLGPSGEVQSGREVQPAKYSPRFGRISSHYGQAVCTQDPNAVPGQSFSGEKIAKTSRRSRGPPIRVGSFKSIREQSSCSLDLGVESAFSTFTLRPSAGASSNTRGRSRPMGENKDTD